MRQPGRATGGSWASRSGWPTGPSSWATGSRQVRVAPRGLPSVVAPGGDLGTLPALQCAPCTGIGVLHAAKDSLTIGCSTVAPSDTSSAS